jgi:hypothetical protein
MMKEFANKATQSKAGLAALGLATLLSFSNVASADNHCRPLLTENGETLSGGGTSLTLSSTSPFPLVIDAKPGRNQGVGNIPEIFVNGAIAKNIDATCVVDKYVSNSGEPEYGFYVAGELIRNTTGKTHFSLSELQADKSIFQKALERAREAQIIARATAQNDLH